MYCCSYDSLTMCLDQPNPDFLSRCRSDRLVYAWITSLLSEETLSFVVDLETSREMWSTFQDAFADVSIEREFLLKQTISMLAKEPIQTMHDYIRYLKNICYDLSLFGKHLSDQDKVFHLHQGLGPSYTHSQRKCYMLLFHSINLFFLFDKL